MFPSRPWSAGARRDRAALTTCLALWVALAAFPARAQGAQPWKPPAGTKSPARMASTASAPRPGSSFADTVVSLAHSARLRFQRQQGDSLGGDNFDGYQVTGDLGRKMLAALGRGRWGSARSIEHTLDSLGLDVEVATDPEGPRMVFMLVRNPFRITADAVGFLYWIREEHVHMQGASYPPSQRVTLRAWNTGHSERPFEAVTVFHLRGERDVVHMRLYRMDPAALSWDLVQYEGNTRDLGVGSRVDFTDVNQDGTPELVVWRKAEPDSFVKLESDAPPILHELIYTERPEGFVLHDFRAVAGVSETVRMFAELLVQNETALARRLLMQPASLDSMLAKGWGRHTSAGAWTIEYGEPGQAWPEWLELKVRQDSGWRHWIFHFFIQNGRWVIRDWIPVREPNPANVVPRPAAAPGAKQP